MIIDVIINFVVLFQIQYKIYVFAKSVVAVAILLPKLSCGCCSSFRLILLVAVLPDPFSCLSGRSFQFPDPNSFWRISSSN
jgi:hypothetical protein